MPEPWWKSAVVYQIYPRSFADSSGDGIGDLEGVRQRLDHLEWLGVDAVWLSPIYPSPMADFGYDVADYCDIDPVFGDLAAFDRLLGDAHRRGIRVLLDWVPNHTSNRHPWFVESRSSPESPKRDWYIWRDGRDPDPSAPPGPPPPPNNWRRTFSNEPAWTFDEATGQYYLHLFLPEQPDLNWNNPEVREAMHGVLRFWLDRGVDGFRADVVHLIGKDPALPDDPPEFVGIARPGFHDYPGTHALLRDIRAVLDSYPGDRMMVGEVNLTDSALVASYYGAGDELHLAFDFGLLHAPWDARQWHAIIDAGLSAFATTDAWPTRVLSNHDEVRHRSRFGGSEARARAAAVILLTSRGTPFLYAGEELGLEDAYIPPDRVVDPGGRDGCRAPVPWTGDPGYGWASADTWLPWPPQAAERNAEDQRADPHSIANLYRRTIAYRRHSPALRGGAMRLLEAPEGVLAYERTSDEDRHVVIANFARTPLAAPIDGTWTVAVASDGAGEGRTFGGSVPPDTALILS